MSNQQLPDANFSSLGKPDRFKALLKASNFNESISSAVNGLNLQTLEAAIKHLQTIEEQNVVTFVDQFVALP
jgi:hypothetical protein